MRNNYCVIMAGGIGSRLWPMSTSKTPKQFHDILGTGWTLLQQTFHRYKNICPPENVFIVTNADYKDLVLEQLPELTENQVLLEPARKNTAPCIAYACYKIQAINPDANIVVAPSDHLILDTTEFERIVKLALETSVKNDCLVTLGIAPSRPDTGYGYIQFEETETGSDAVKKVKLFTEKPDLEFAKQFIASGDFVWNSGMFIWHVESIIRAMEKHLPEIHELFYDGIEIYNTAKEANFINETYPRCTSISIDYGIMEKSENVFVIPADFGWSDLGTWGSLYTHLGKDDNRNAAVGSNVMLYDSSDCIINAASNKLVVLQGLDDYIVVDTEKSLLVCKKQDEQKIKQFVTDVKLTKGEDLV